MRRASRASDSGAGPAPTAIRRSSSMTRWPSACSVPAVSIVATAQPSMTVRLIASTPAGSRQRRRSSNDALSWRALHPLGSEPHGVDDLLVARAAAEVARERLADLRVARARIARQQVVRGDDQPRRAEAALHAAGLDERALHLVQLAVGRRDPLDGHDLAALGLRGKHETRADELAVEVHRARAALALLAGVLRAGQVEVLAQRGQQALALPDAVGLARCPVDDHVETHHASPRYSFQVHVRARRASTPSAWRRYAAVPRTSSIGRAARSTSAPNSATAAAPSGARDSHRPSSMSTPATNDSARVGRIGVGPAEPMHAFTARSSGHRWTDREQTAMTIALRVPIFANCCGPPAGATWNAAMSSSSARALR